MERDNFDVEAGLVMNEVAEEIRWWCRRQALLLAEHQLVASNGCPARERFEDSTNALVPSSMLSWAL
jgi:hypothetical protein